MKNTSPILQVEDDVVDVMSVKRALRVLNVNNPLCVASNGEDALARLRDDSQPLPGLILLDINMPRMSGIDFLRILKSDERLKRLPVVMLTTSREERDRLESFNLSVAGYMIKPVDYENFVQVIRTIQTYWMQSETAP
jgi:CheY-like chemotaxis protein